MLEFHRIEQMDMHYFDKWGTRVAEGDWLSTTVGVPMHPWHHEVARNYLARISTFPTDAVDVPAAEAEKVWATWAGLPRFYQDPLYPYLVGVTYRVFGPSPPAVFVIQMIAGLAGIALLWLITRRFFGDTAALCAGGLAVLCGPLLHYELFLLRDSLVAVMGLLAIWLAIRAFDVPRVRAFGLLGIAVAAGVLLKGTFLLFAVGFGLAMLWQLRGRQLASLLSAFAAGLLIGVAPAMARNAAVGAPLLALSGLGPVTFAAANGTNYPVEGGFFVDPPELARVMSVSGGGMVATMRAVWREHSAGSLASLTGRKLDRAFHWYEIPNNENYSYTKRQAGVLRLLPVTAFTLVPLGLLGVLLYARRSRELWLLFFFVGASLVPLLLFYVLGRFRIALLVALVPFAGATLAWIIACARERRIAAIAGALLVIVVVGSWSGRPLSADIPPIRSTDWLLPYLAHYEEPIERAATAREPAAMVSLYYEFFERYEPSWEEVLEQRSPDLARSLAALHGRCAAALRALGRDEEARTQQERAGRLMTLAS